MIGIRELFIITVVALALYGRSGVLRSERFQSIWPWVAPVRRHPSSSRRRRGPGQSGRAAPDSTNEGSGSRRGWMPRFVLEGNRLYWALTIMAATAIAAWIVTRTLIVSSSNGFR